MDVTSIDEAVRQVRTQPYAKVGLPLTAILDDNQRDANLCVIDDSTGVDTVEQATGTDRRWVYLLAQLIGQDFPAYTVKHRQWNATNLNYDAATTIQTGSGTGNGGGPFTLTVWGATKSGATVAYWLTQLVTPSTVFPSTMDLVLLCDGHNETGHGSDTRGTFYKLHRAVNYLAPGVAIGWVTQNPQNGAGASSSAAEEKNQLMRMEEVRTLARSEGVGIIDITPAFRADPNYKTNLILADGIHPNAAGSALWAAEAKKHFPLVRDPYNAPTGGPIPKPSRIWVPATAFASIVGAPVAGSIQNVPAWRLPSAAQSIVSTTVDWPAQWKSVNLWAAWTQATTDAGKNWRGRVGNQRISGTFEPSSGSGTTLGGAISAGTLTTIASRTANTVGYQALGGTAVDAITGFTGRPMMFQAERLGTDGADTLTQDVYFLGLIVERNS